MQATTQNCFSKGELDPTLISRYDIDLYTKGARRLRNMFALWTGAARLAPGSIFIDQIMDRTAVPPVPITDYTLIKANMFEYDADLGVIFTFVLRPDTTSGVAIDVYLNNYLQTSVPAPQYVSTDIANIFFADGQDRILLLNENIPTTQLVNNGAPNLWTLSNYVFSTFPAFDYTVLGGTQYRVPGFTFQVGQVSGNTNLVSSSPIFNVNHKGGLFLGNGGIARITSISTTGSTAGKYANITTIEDFTNTSVFPGTQSSLNEVMWTSGGGSGITLGPNRGWPARGIFYLNRLALGRSLYLNNVMAFSTVGVYDDFDDAFNDDAAGFSFTLNYKGNDSLQDFAGDDAIIFVGASTIYATNPYTENFLTVSSFYAPPQGGEGSSSIPSVQIDNQIFHTTSDRTQLIKMYYDPGKAKLVSHTACLLSSHLIETINSMAAWLPSNLSAKLLLATQEDGSLLMLSTLDDEIVNAWSLRTTRGEFRQVMGEKNESNAIIERQIQTDGIYDAVPNYVYYTDAQMDGFDNITLDVTDLSVSNVILAVEDSYLLIGNDVPWTSVQLMLTTDASSDCMLTFEYMDVNGQWNFFTPTDGTSGMTMTGNISWTFEDVNSWEPNNIFDTQNIIYQQYWIRIRTTATSVTTPPSISQVSINLTKVLYLEQFDINTYMDCQIQTTTDSNGNITGLTQLAGQQVYAIWNGTTYGPFFVDIDGNTNVDQEMDVVLIGLQFKPYLTPMPVFVATQQGDNLYERRYIQKIYVDFYESLYLQAASKDIPVMFLGSYTLDSNIQPPSGFFIINPMQDWEPRQEIVITQSIPGPMTIRSIGYNIQGL